MPTLCTTLIDTTTAFMQSPAFDANPIGEPFDPDLLAARYDAGESVVDVVFRSDQSPVELVGARK